MACADGVHGEVCDKPGGELWLDTSYPVSAQAHAHKTDAWNDEGINGSTNDASSHAYFNPATRTWGASSSAGSSGVGGVIGTTWAKAHASVTLEITDHFKVTKDGLQTGQLILKTSPVVISGIVDGDSNEGRPKPAWDSTASYAYRITSSRGDVSGLLLRSKDSNGFYNSIETGPKELVFTLGDVIEVTINLMSQSNSYANNFLSDGISEETMASTYSDFEHTFRWGGFSSIRNADTGEELRDYVLSSDSGVQWNLASPVPEPDSTSLLIAGLSAGLLLKRRRMTNNRLSNETASS